MIRVKRSILGAFTIAEMEVRKIRHNSTELWTRVVQPALWLLVFGEVLNKIKDLSPTGFSYLQFITPGVLAQSVLFVSIFYGITVVWERDVGLLTKLLSTPSPRLSIIVGKSLAASVRGLFQAIMIFLLALIIGVNLRFDILDIFGVLIVIVLFAMCFSSLSMLLASRQDDGNWAGTHYAPLLREQRNISCLTNASLASVHLTLQPIKLRCRRHESNAPYWRLLKPTTRYNCTIALNYTIHYTGINFNQEASRLIITQ